VSAEVTPCRRRRARRSHAIVQVGGKEAAGGRTRIAQRVNPAS
jgi:hypothetical protein